MVTDELVAVLDETLLTASMYSGLVYSSAKASKAYIPIE